MDEGAGDVVRLDDPLCEIETEKVTAELPSPFEGTMEQILVPQGETVEVGTPLCEVVEAAVATGQPASGGGDGSGSAAHGDPARRTAGSRPCASAGSGPGTCGSLAGGSADQADERERFYSPAVMRLAGNTRLTSRR